MQAELSPPKRIRRFLLDRVLERIPVLGRQVRRHRQLGRLAVECGYPPGHFYSPIPSLSELEADAQRVFSDDDPLDIDLNLEAQVALLDEFESYRESFPYDFLSGKEDPHHRYKWIAGCQYRYSDVVFLYCIMRHLRPRRIIEIGSGASSAAMLDFNDIFFESSISATFIDPYPQRLLSMLRESDKTRYRTIAERVQDVPLETFLSLRENDILFVDSSHTVKAGSDVNHIVFEILPRLAHGVCIHFHDVFFPFELPKRWILKHRRFWSENHLLRAFLMNNNAYEVLIFNTYLQKKRRHWFEENMPECLIGDDSTGSIWLRKR